MQQQQQQSLAAAAARQRASTAAASGRTGQPSPDIDGEPSSPDRDTPAAATTRQPGRPPQQQQQQQQAYAGPGGGQRPTALSLVALQESHDSLPDFNNSPLLDLPPSPRSSASFWLGPSSTGGAAAERMAAGGTQVRCCGR